MAITAAQEQMMGDAIKNACFKFLDKLRRRGELPIEATDEITQDGLDNLAIVKQAEADFLRQDLG